MPDDTLHDGPLHDDALDAAVLHQLLAHLDARRDVQNIELMNLAGFCRNCLAKWYAEEASKRGLDISVDDAKTYIYRMPYGEWKAKFQR